MSGEMREKGKEESMASPERRRKNKGNGEGSKMNVKKS